MYLNLDEPVAYQEGEFPGITKRELFHLVAMLGTLVARGRPALPQEIPDLAETACLAAEAQLSHLAETLEKAGGSFQSP